MKMHHLFAYLGMSILLLSMTNCGEQKSPQMDAIPSTQQTMYIGTYTRAEGHVDGKAEGIYCLNYDREKGVFGSHKTISQSINPSFLAIGKKKKLLFAVNELAQPGENQGLLEVFKINTPDSITLLQTLGTVGRAPCHISINKNENIVIVSNYADGILMVYQIKENDVVIPTDTITLTGSSSHPRQEGPHLHSALIHESDQKVYVADLGTDLIRVFELNEEEGKLVAMTNSDIKLAAGAGPRHMDINQAGNLLYVVNELNNSISVISLGNDHKIIQEINVLPEDFIGKNTTADIHLHPSGNYLYCSNRGHNSISIFYIKEDGTLELTGGEGTKGEIPRNFVINPSGTYLHVANQNSDNIVTFVIDENTGTLQYQPPMVKIPTPVCLTY